MDDKKALRRVFYNTTRIGGRPSEKALMRIKEVPHHREKKEIVNNEELNYTKLSELNKKWRRHSKRPLKTSSSIFHKSYINIPNPLPLSIETIPNLLNNDISPPSPPNVIQQSQDLIVVWSKANTDITDRNSSPPPNKKPVTFFSLPALTLSTTNTRTNIQTPYPVTLQRSINKTIAESKVIKQDIVNTLKLEIRPNVFIFIFEPLAQKWRIKLLTVALKKWKYYDEMLISYQKSITPMAIEIQRIWRGYIGRKTVRRLRESMRMRKEKATITLQAGLRGMRDRYIVKALKEERERERRLRAGSRILSLFRYCNARIQSSRLEENRLRKALLYFMDNRPVESFEVILKSPFLNDTDRFILRKCIELLNQCSNFKNKLKERKFIDWRELWFLKEQVQQIKINMLEREREMNEQKERERRNIILSKKLIDDRNEIERKTQIKIQMEKEESIKRKLSEDREAKERILREKYIQDRKVREEKERLLMEERERKEIERREKDNEKSIYLKKQGLEERLSRKRKKLRSHAQAKKKIQFNIYHDQFVLNVPSFSKGRSLISLNVNGKVNNMSLALYNAANNIYLLQAFDLKLVQSLIQDISKSTLFSHVIIMESNHKIYIWNKETYPNHISDSAQDSLELTSLNLATNPIVINGKDYKINILRCVEYVESIEHDLNVIYNLVGEPDILCWKQRKFIFIQGKSIKNMSQYFAAKISISLLEEIMKSEGVMELSPCNYIISECTRKWDRLEYINSLFLKKSAETNFMKFVIQNKKNKEIEIWKKDSENTSRPSWKMTRIMEDLNPSLQLIKLLLHEDNFDNESMSVLTIEDIMMVTVKNKCQNMICMYYSVLQRLDYIPGRFNFISEDSTTAIYSNQCLVNDSDTIKKGYDITDGLNDPETMEVPLPGNMIDNIPNDASANPQTNITDAEEILMDNQDYNDGVEQQEVVIEAYNNEVSNNVDAEGEELLYNKSENNIPMTMEYITNDNSDWNNNDNFSQYASYDMLKEEERNQYYPNGAEQQEVLMETYDNIVNDNIDIEGKNVMIGTLSCPTNHEDYLSSSWIPAAEAEAVEGAITDEPPQPLVDNLWYTYIDEEGNQYYYNSVTGETSWDIPT